jgi:hypothetical protein
MPQRIASGFDHNLTTKSDIRRLSRPFAVVSRKGNAADSGQRRMLTNRSEQGATPCTSKLRNWVSGGLNPSRCTIVFGFTRSRRPSDHPNWAGSALAGFPRRSLESPSIALPPRGVARRHVVVVGPQPDNPVNEFPDYIGVTSVPVGFGNHVHQDPVQRHLPALLQPTWYVADRIQGQRINRRIAMRPCTPLQRYDLVSRLIGSRPHVGIRFSIVFKPGQRLARWATEGGAKVAKLDAGHVFHRP